MDSASLIQQAHKAIQAGQKVQARHLLQQAIRQNPQDFRAWLWLASITASPQASLEYVKRAEMLKPHNPIVQQARAWAEKRLEAEMRGEGGRAKEEERREEKEGEKETRERGKVTAVPPLPPSQSPASWQSLAIRVSVALFVVILLTTGGLFAWNSWLKGASTGTAPVAVQQANLGAVASAATTVPATPTITPSATAQPIQPKNIVAASDNPRPTWTLTPTPTNTPIPTNTPPPTFVSTSGGIKPAVRPLGVAADERWIDVDLSSQVLVAFEGNEPIFDTYISSGTYDHPTVTGQFRIWIKYESQTMDGTLLGYDYYLENVPYVMYFYNDYALHGTFWHNNFGTPMSHGCVNMRTSDAQWVYSWAGVGTVVNVHY